VADRPTLYLSNWSSHASPGHHGPGRKLTIMASPRAWENGEGRVAALTPEAADVAAAKSGRRSMDAYQEKYSATLAADARFLVPSILVFGRAGRQVEDGDTLCCACSREAAAKGECHRVWAAHALVKAGWRVVLDGLELEGA
jgi:hypothetical protein